MLGFVQETLEALEHNPDVATREKAFASLRPLGLGIFAEILMQMPLDMFPRLSRLLPYMASEEVQLLWTGGAGAYLLKLSLSFVRSLGIAYGQLTGRPIAEARILDFGCGYGRLARLMYYFVDSEHLYGVDPWERSIEECRNARLGDNFRLCERLPNTLPVDDLEFDLIYAFSVYTHLPERVVRATLSTLRRNIRPDGLLCITIRPVEYWDAAPMSEDERKQIKAAHAEGGFAFIPHGPADALYGDCTMTLDWIDRNATGWRRAGVDWSLEDPLQIYVFLQPA